MAMHTTLWKNIAGYEGVYQVSNTGRVRRVGKAKGSTQFRVLTLKGFRKRSYSYCDLSMHDKKKRFMVHRLVAIAFIGPPPFEKAVVNHLNGKRRDNRPENLEWTSYSGNALHAFASGLKVPTDINGERNPRAKLNRQQVAEIRALRGIVGARRLASRYEVSRTAIQMIHQGKHW